MKKPGLLLVFVCFGMLLSDAQQLSFNNQYLINRYMLSPAYAGHNNNFEVFAGYRKSWLDGAPNSPSSQTVNMNGRVHNNSGIGLDLRVDQAGIFRNMSAQAAYSHRVGLGEGHELRIGASAGVFESRVDVSAQLANSQDPVIANNGSFGGATFDAGAAIAYQYRFLTAGIVVERLIHNRVTAEHVFYTMARHYSAYAGYTFFLNKEITIEPMAVARKTAVSDLNFDAAALVKFQKKYWMGLLYRHEYAGGLQIGGVFFDRVAVGYSYELPMGGIAAQSTGTHEISLGVAIGNEAHTPSSIFQRTTNRSSYYQWVD